MSRFSGPLPPALLTNAFANPLEVCATGGNHYDTWPPSFATYVTLLC